MERYRPPHKPTTPIPLERRNPAIREEFVQVLLFANALRFHADNMSYEQLRQIRGGAESLCRADPFAEVEMKTMMECPEAIFNRIFQHTMTRVRTLDNGVKREKP